MTDKQTTKTIGHVEIERELGRGGMGVVRLGRQLGLDRPVVVKTLRRSLAEDPSLEERFIREACSAAAVHHQNVVCVYDCFVWRNERFIVQEFVDGVDLSSVLTSTARLAPDIAILIALELTRGLEEIHALGIVHRDLKPSNILVSRAGATKIADFGIALRNEAAGLTQTGHAVGTPLYMSPEQLLGERADSRSDIFSVGIVLYEMLTGRVPFPDSEDAPGGSLVRRMQAGRYTRLRRVSPETPRALARLIAKCLKAKPHRRIESATALRESLERMADAASPGVCRVEIAAWLWGRGVFSPGEDGTVVVSRLPRRRSRRSRALRWVAAAALCGGLAAAAGSVGWVELGEQIGPELRAHGKRTFEALFPAEASESEEAEPQ